MNWNIVKGNWKQFKGVIQGQWGRLTDDPVDEIAGKQEELEGKIQETYGKTEDEVDKTVEQRSTRSKS